MPLIIDIGNTRTKLAWFAGGTLREQWSRERWGVTDLEEWRQKYDYQRVILAAVGALPEGVEAQLQTRTTYLRLDHRTPLPIQNAYRSPETLGVDRLAAVVGAAAQFPGENCLVIDAGTCITYDFVDAAAIYHGGGISPGMSMRLRAMQHFTARLPLVEAEAAPIWIGVDTQSSLRSGAQWGMIFEIEGFIRRYTDRFGKINVLLTGGDANFLANHLKTKIFTNSNLVLLGLNKILDHNVQLPG